MEIISSYSRQQAIEDGVLGDVTEQAAETGFRCPVAITTALISDLNDIPENSCEDFRGRLHDVLFCAFVEASRNYRISDAFYKVLIGGTEKELRMNAGPGDHAELVITIGYPSDF